MSDANDMFDAGKFGACVEIGFQTANATTGLSNADMTCEQDSVFVAPHSGSVVGMSLRGNAAVTAGQIAARAHKAGVEFAQDGYPNPTLDTDNPQNSYGNIRPGVLTFDAGDTLGVSLTASTTLEPTNSLEIDAWLMVQFDKS